MNSDLEKSKHLLSQGALFEAEELLKKCYERDNSQDEMIVLLAAVSMDLRKYEQAKSYCQKLIQQKKQFFLAHYFLGEIAEKEGEFSEALEKYSLALTIDPLQEKPFQKFVSLVSRSGRLSDYQIDADIIFVSGGPFHDFRFNGSSIEKRAMGGTESALIYMAREMAKLGKKIIVFCACDEPGIYEGVEYRHNRDFEVCTRLSTPTVVIACRSENYLHEKTVAGKKLLWIHDIPNAIYDHFKEGRYFFDQIFCLSEYQKKIWQKHYPIDSSYFFQTTNGFDESLFITRPEFSERRQLIYISRPHRGLTEAIQVFAELRKKKPELEMVVCTYSLQDDFRSDDEWKPYLSLLSTPGIIMRGSLTKRELAHELQKSYFLLYPNVSEAETSCIAAIEAMAAGCPVISSDRGALPETVIHEKTGLLVSYSENKEEFLKQLIQKSETLLSKEKWESLSREAYEYAHKKYPWSFVAQSWLGKLFPFSEFQKQIEK